ncbi:hypothetical protein KY284_010895 [Solanum tuberosum]|nr:hypothetical protein KY284_010895 [Solanum tuberosum]
MSLIAVGIRGRTMSSAVRSRSWFCRCPEFVAPRENQFSCGSSFPARILCLSAAAILYSAGNFGNSGNSAAAILYSAGNS